MVVFNGYVSLSAGMHAPKIKSHHGNHHHPASRSPRGPLLGCSIAPSKRFFRAIEAQYDQNDTVANLLPKFSTFSNQFYDGFIQIVPPLPELKSPSFPMPLVAKPCPCLKLLGNELHGPEDECSGLHYPCGCGI